MSTSLKECFSDKNIQEVYIATGYWDIPGLTLLTEDIRLFLERDGTSLKLLIGKDPFVFASQSKLPKYKDASYPLDYIRIDINELELKEEYEAAIRLLMDYCTDEKDSKIQIRIYRKDETEDAQFLHSKCYIFDGLSASVAYGFIGSSNFTKKGLEDNSELNYLETDVHRVLSDTKIPNNKSHKQWFFEKWNCSDPWNKEFLEQVLKPAPITKHIKEKASETKQPFTPYELYIKLLQLTFGDIIDKNLGEQIEAYLPQKMITLKYQIEAVKRCLSIMHEHGGFMLADVVGLGKTIIGSLVVKRFLSVPEDDGHERRVLIITPPAIKSAWVKTINDFDKDCDDHMMPKIDFITTGRITCVDEDEDEDGDGGVGKEGEDSGEFVEELEESNYGLIIIDESHKFRNSTTQMYEALDNLIGHIFERTGIYPYVGLLSATPQNNRPNDLKNQIYLFERNHIESTLKKARSGNIESFFAEADREYSLLISRNNPIPKAERIRRLKDLSRHIRECVLSDILVRRTRTDVRKYYEEDIEAQGLKFPKTIGPTPQTYIMDRELAHLFSDTMTYIAPTETEIEAGVDYLGYYRYRSIEFFNNDENKRKYQGRGNRSAEAVAKQLANIMQMLLVKRLESSFAAFTKSLNNLLHYTENMIQMWEANSIFVCPDIDVNSELDIEKKSDKRKRKVTFEECCEDIRKRIRKLTENGKNERHQNAEYTREDFDPRYWDLLHEDYELIKRLCVRWAQNTEDPKFDAFKEHLKPVFFNPKTNTSGKLVIFSEAIDTVRALTRAVQAKGYRVLEITAKNRDKLEDTIAANFDANYEEEWQNDYDVIITTEVLAEGINLHRANVILNYDTPWNATRLMQRIGRVNRIGSQADYVYVYNFFPSAEGDAEISLVRKAYTKLQSFHILFGEDNKIFSDEEEIVQYELEQIPDDEESPMEKYVYELKQYREAHPERFAQIEAMEDKWEVASYQDGNAYFLIKAPRSSRLAVKVPKDANERPQIISTAEMLETLKVPEDTPIAPLPENWSEICKKALKTYNQYFVKINKSRAGSKATDAKAVLHKILQIPNLTKETKNLLILVRKLIDLGNYDIIRKILSLEPYLDETQGQLFALCDEDINQLIEREIAKLVSNVELKQGEANILLGTSK